MTRGDLRWLMLVYKVPVEPARIRAMVWRRLKGLGAIYLQDGIAALPATASVERALRALQSEITSLGGVGYVVGHEVLAGQSEITAAYNAARDEEYTEILSRCADFEAEIERELVERHLTYAELEENDEDLSKLKSWLAKVQTRDVLGAGNGAKAVEAVARCEVALEAFAQAVYESEGAR